ncbi:hypothetical protein TRVL_00777 [Trypanosoma vivax]|uniref:Uncharacterized protein n=1 Tax=Trypanosoma vivax (strain Y486) TaxID=1055687 RepID=G0U112_TRYVY|nr:hypothetical protein TRVL_00777 [Trypanosoma vivax]CCC49767.1 conserved hypothetical protein [Trypanosoma vivax Y486]
MSSGCASVCRILHRSLSLILAIILTSLTVIYSIGGGYFVKRIGSTEGDGIAHILAIVFSCVGALGYISLHFLPRRSRYLLYLITIVLLCSIWLLFHSSGLLAPVVNDCNMTLFGNYTHMADLVADIHRQDNDSLLNITNETIVRGRLGEPVRECKLSALMCITAVTTGIAQFFALLDIQKVTVSRAESDIGLGGVDMSPRYKVTE